MILFLLFGTAAATLLNQTQINFIRTQTHLWHAHDNFTNPLRHKTENQLIGLLGAPVVEERNVQLTESLLPVQSNLPQSFDSRQQWPLCNYEIQDQQQCGSCVYFSSAIYLGQRFCKETNGSVNLLLSPQYTLNCDNNIRDQKCKGAYLDSVNQFLVDTGTVEKSCVNYISGNGKTLESCQSKCRDGSPLKMYKCKNLKRFNTIQSIQQEILINGPVQAQYNVYSDFYNYKTGIYHYVSGYQVGGHAVVLLGWGIENGISYWIAQNQWGANWGENGFFRIAFGQVGIDSGVYACQPAIGTSPQPNPVDPQPNPDPIKRNCQAEVMSCLKQGNNVAICNQAYFKCLYPTK